METALPKVIYIMGPPGAGKGTQAMLLTREIGYEHFSTGDAIRKIAKMDTALGKQIKEINEQGILCPPEIVAEIVIEAVKDTLSRGEGVVFDGTPRTEIEAGIVDTYFTQAGYGRPLALLLDTDKATMVERNSKRRFCLGVEKGFPIIFKSDEAQCTAAGGTIGTRVDDDPAKFDTRWNEFMERTMPVIEGYKQEGILHVVNGKGSIDVVHKEIVQLINSLYHTSYSHDYPEELA
jgi:adenylate kinase